MGSKMTEVAEKVATDTAEDLKRAAGEVDGGVPGKSTSLHSNVYLNNCMCVIWEMIEQMILYLSLTE